MGLTKDIHDIYTISKNEAKEMLQEEGCLEFLKHGMENELSPEWDDLARIYFLVRKRKPFQVLEFGSGFSTLIIAYALKNNWDEYLNGLNDEKEVVRKYEQPHLVALESSEKWKKNTLKKLDSVNLSNFVDIEISGVEISEYNGQICHYYKNLPDIVPDFVYLDGPDPATVSGNINGLSFKNPRRTVMSADLLKYESSLLPGFFMIVDGRTNNCRFLNRNLQRNFIYQYHKEADVSTFELDEERLGRKNVFGWEAYGNEPVYFAENRIS